MSFYVFNGEKLDPNVQHVFGDTQYPPKWFSGAGNREAMGVKEGVSTAVPSHDPVLQRVVELPLAEINGVWTQQWDVIELYATQAERDAAEAAAAALKVPQSVTRYQGLIALEDAGLLTTVESAIANAPKKTQIAFSNAHVWRRASSMVSDMQAVLGMTDAEVDALFIAADAVD